MDRDRDMVTDRDMDTVMDRELDLVNGVMTISTVKRKIRELPV
jgi:hypothetical protein